MGSGPIGNSYIRPAKVCGIVTAMIAFALAIAIVQKEPITVPAFKTFDGKSWASIALGTSEKDLKKQLKTSKTVGPDPASIRLLVAQKGWVVAGILTDVKERGTLCGFTAELERDEPIQSLESLQEELGPSDFVAYPRLRYSDWSLAVWKDKGIAAVVTGGGRPSVQKVLMTSPETLVQNLDLWDRSRNGIREDPRIPVSGFDISVSIEPRDSTLESVCLSAIRRSARRLMDDYRGPGWEPARQNGNRIDVRVRIKRKAEYAIDGSISLSSHDELGDITISQSTSDSVKRDVEVAERAARQFEYLMARVPKEIEDKIRRPMWQAEWRPFTALARARQ